MTICEVPIYDEVYKIGSREPERVIHHNEPATNFWNEQKAEKFWNEWYGRQFTGYINPVVHTNVDAYPGTTWWHDLWTHEEIGEYREKFWDWRLDDE